MKSHIVGNSKVYLRDCVSAMKEYPDKYFDLAVVDPPYGIKINMNMGIKKGQPKRHKNKDWDNEIPPDEYFKELFRASKNQIIWGGNYFNLPPTMHFIFWDKLNPDGLSFSDGEMAWTSFNRAIRKYSKRNIDPDKIHPTQKPVALYDWILSNYAEKGMHILDTHLGSGSSRISAEKMGLDFTGFEIDEEYFDDSVQRFNIYKSQLVMEFV